MNDNHARVCGGAEWARYMQDELLPELVGERELGERMIEVGPGPGATTEWLRHRVGRLIAVELEPEAAAALTRRFDGSNVEVVCDDATALPFADASFDSAGAFTMLHHLPSVALQNRLLAELLRVLRPGGTLIGSDSLASASLHAFHVGDIYNPVEPASLLIRLQTLGYEAITLGVAERLTFVAHKAAG